MPWTPWKPMIRVMADSPFDPRPLRQARALLADPVRSESLLPLTAAAALFAASALGLVVLVISLPSPWPV